MTLPFEYVSHFVAALVEANDRDRLIMGLIASATNLAQDGDVRRTVTADALLQSAIELDADIVSKARELN